MKLFFYLCRKYKVELHCSRTHHPQSQGMIKCSHRELRKKIHHDMIKLRKKGVKWAQNLLSYMRVLNELAAEHCLRKALLKCWQNTKKYSEYSKMHTKTSYRR